MGLGRPGRRFSLASLVGVVFAAFALASAPTATAQGQLAASCEPAEGGASNFSSIDAQVFTSQVSGSLDRAQINVFKEASDPPSDSDYVFEVRDTDLSGEPADVLASAVVPEETVPTGETTAFTSADFAEPPLVVQGDLYAVSIRRPDSSVTYGVRNDCPGQLWSSFDGGSSWSAPDDFDMVFRVFVTPPPPPQPPPPPPPTPPPPPLPPPQQPQPISAVSATCKGTPATLVGTPGDDLLIGTNGPDVIVALGGNDKVSGLQGDDLICGDAGKDKLTGGKDKDKLFGQKGADTLKGGEDDDTCKGGKGRDNEKFC